MIKSAKVLVAYEASHPSALDRQISVPTPGDNAGTSLFRAGYGSAGSITDSCGQVASLIDSDGGSTHVADYLYLGLGTVVQQDSPQANLRYTLIDLAGSNDPDTGDIYAGLDRFSRIKDLRWRSTSANSDLSRIRYGYDRASSRIWRENPSDTNRHYDWLYANDGMHRLHDAQRGQLNAGHTAITSPQFGQCWTLDETGNWQGFRQDDDGNGSWDLIQARTSNPVNEITDIDNTTGSSWATPAYDANGNTTLIPRPDLGTNKSMIATWDAWNRLVKLINPDTNQTLVEFVYDGRNFRIVNKEYASGTLSATRHLYYTDSWQALEERVNTSTAPERQHVWGIRYIDDLLLRDRDTNADGTLDERLYHVPDANWNVTAVVDASGSVQERIEYTPYGQLQFLAPNFGLRTASSYDIRTTYTSREWVPEIALYFLRNRWLHPMLGRFCSRDPVGYEGSDRSLREYAASNPEKYVDPDGTRTCTPAEHAACNSACLQQQNVTGNAHNCSTHYIINWGCFKWGVNKAPCKCHKKKQPQKGCKPCKPPVGSVAYRVDRDGAPHNDPDGNPIAVPHSHVFVMNQIPADAKPPATPCDCFWQEVLKDPLPGELAPEIAPAGGGGAT